MDKQTTIQNAAKYLSPTALSNLFTMGVAARNDQRQAMPSGYGIPSLMVRELRARLILEEALETVVALGFHIKPTAKLVFDMDDVVLLPADGDYPANLEEVVDGCCDTIYVAVGTLLVCGAADLPHMAAVNHANDSKFPGGVAITNPETGKFQKPPGWQPPHHTAIFAQGPLVDLHDITAALLEG